MKETLHQSQELKQQQRLTPMQVQFVRMLEMTGPEIEMEVKRAVDEMPALEAVDAGGGSQEDDSGETFNESAEEIQLADYRSDDDIPSYRFEAHNHSSDDIRYEPVAVSEDTSMLAVLTAQLAETDLTARQIDIARYIIGNLDDNGYLKRSLDAIADDLAIHQSMEISPEELRHVYDIIRSLDPPGIGAIDLRDCLLLQLRRMKPSPDIDNATEIISHYFDLFSKKHFQRLGTILNLSTGQMQDAVAVIRRLNPKPGSRFGDSEIEKSARQIVPEFLVETDNNEITLTLLNNIPELAIEQSFAEGSPIPGLTPRERSEAQTFIKVRRDEASSFIKTLSMRQQTLYRVMAAIVKIQREFFLSGDETRLKPMILKDIAALTGYDLSVISRATASKYVMTPSGVYPLKFFFNERPKVEDDASFHQIADALRRLIENEDKNSPMSDEALTAAINGQGFNIARRTVAKYREKLGFPVARLRKEL